MTNYKIVGNEYTSPDFDADKFARKMIEKCEAVKFPWEQIRMDSDGRVYAFVQKRGVALDDIIWTHKGDRLPMLLTQLDGDEVSWKDFGIIRTDAPPYMTQPERTIADAVTIADNRLTPELIAALSEWPDSALDIIAQAVVDGRIVLQ